MNQEEGHYIFTQEFISPVSFRLSPLFMCSTVSIENQRHNNICDMIKQSQS